MRIALHSAVRPTRIAKAIRNHLAGIGRDIPYSKVREAVAVMYGYRSWNDVLGQAGRTSPSPYDQEAPEGVAAERRAVFSARLAQALSLTFDQAQAAVDAAGPTSRRTRALADAAFDWDVTLHRMARSMTEQASSVRPIEVEGRHGFRLTLPSEVVINGDEDGTPVQPRVIHVANRGWDILVGEDASVRFHPSHGYGVKPRYDRQDDGFGRCLQKAGLLSGEPGGADPDPLVLATLSRLDGHAMGLLRAAPVFTPAAYDLARSIPRDGPLSRLVMRLPMLGAEFEHITFLDSRRIAYPPALRARDAMPTSADPIEEYLDLVADNARTSWPHLYDREATRRTVEAIGALVVPYEVGLTPYHVAFLALAPPSRLPDSPRQMAAALAVADGWHPMLEAGIGMAPANFYVGFEGDWVGMLASVGRLKHTHALRNLGLVAECVSRAFLGHHLSWDGMKEADCPFCVDILSARLTPLIVDRRGFLDLVGAYDAWRVATSVIWKETPDDAPFCWRTSYAALAWTTLMPETATRSEPEDVLRLVGIDPAVYLEAMTDGAETTRAELEVRLTLPAWRAAVEEALRLSPRMDDHVTGSLKLHKATIGGRAFEAIMSSDGPCLQVIRGGTRYDAGPLGIHARLTDRVARDGRHELWMDHGSKATRLLLETYGPDDVDAFMREFGLGTEPGEVEAFHRSNAGAALARFVRTHPRLAFENAAEDRDLPGWYQSALGEGYRLWSPSRTAPLRVHKMV